MSTGFLNLSLKRVQKCSICEAWVWSAWTFPFISLKKNFICSKSKPNCTLTWKMNHMCSEIPSTAHDFLLKKKTVWFFGSTSFLLLVTITNPRELVLNVAHSFFRFNTPCIHKKKLLTTIETFYKFILFSPAYLYVLLKTFIMFPQKWSAVMTFSKKRKMLNGFCMIIKVTETNVGNIL